MANITRARGQRHWAQKWKLQRADGRPQDAGAREYNASTQVVRHALRRRLVKALQKTALRTCVVIGENGPDKCSSGTANSRLAALRRWQTRRRQTGGNAWLGIGR